MLFKKGRIIKVGHSRMVTIPFKFLQRFNLDVNDRFTISDETKFSLNPTLVIKFEKECLDQPKITMRDLEIKLPIRKP